MRNRQRHEIAVGFEKLGHLFISGVPFLQAVRTVKAECRDKTVAKALGDICDRVSRRQDVADILAEYGDTFPQSVQLLWKAGQKKDLEQCCLRIAAILRAEARWFD